MIAPLLNAGAMSRRKTPPLTSPRRYRGTMPWRDFGSPGKLERVERDALSDPIAEKAYRKLRANGLSSVGQFWELVNMVVALHLEPADRDPGWWRSPKILAGLPRNFKATAGMIERLNRDPRFSLDRQFMEVPAILRKRLGND